MACAKHRNNFSDSDHFPSCLRKMEGWRFCRISQFLSHTHPEICIDDVCKRSLALCCFFLSVSIALQPPDLKQSVIRVSYKKKKTKPLSKIWYCFFSITWETQSNTHICTGQVSSLLTALIHFAFLTLWRRSKWMALTPGMQNFKISLTSLFQHLEIFINYPSVSLMSARSVLWVAHSFRSWQIIRDILIKLIPQNNYGSHTTTFSISVKTVPVAVDLGLYFIVLYSWFLISTWFFQILFSAPLKVSSCFFH